MVGDQDAGRSDKEAEPEETRGFRVIDRRGSADEASESPQGQAGGAGAAAGPAPPERPPAGEAGGPAQADPAGRSGGPGAAGGADASGEGALPAIDFPTFLVSLSTSAFYHMGLVEEPGSGEPSPKNLPMARQTIDILELLQEKTRGNLEPDEARLLESLLYELRMRFVEASR